MVGESKRRSPKLMLQLANPPIDGLHPLWAGKPQLLLVVCKAGWRLALDQDRCIQILRECGFLPTGPVGLVNLGQIPEGLSAEELARLLRENGAETRGFRGAQNHGRGIEAGLEE